MKWVGKVNVLQGENAEVVVNPNNGKIISVNPTSSAKARQLLSKDK